MDPEETSPKDQEAVNVEATMEDPLAELEKVFINRFLEENGYRWCELVNLPADQLKKIMTDACMYASARLAEVEAKVGFRQEIRYK